MTRRPRPEPHRVWPDSASRRAVNWGDHAAGYWAAIDNAKPPTGGSGGKPPRRGCLSCLFALLVLMLARHRREPDGEPLGRRANDPKHAAGDWYTDRDTAGEQEGGGKRPPLRDSRGEQR